MMAEVLTVEAFNYFLTVFLIFTVPVLLFVSMISFFK